MAPVSPARQKIRYIDSFDSLRGFAVLLVMLVHVSYGILIGGWIGVDLFFVLSGYLITSLLLNEYVASGNISFLKFYARRALRLFPPLIICVLLANILWSVTRFDAPVPNQVTASSAALFYFTNFLPIYATGNMSHLWSLSVEEHFYFFWPLIVSGFLMAASYRNRITFLLILILGVTVFKIVVFNFIDHRMYGLLQIDSYRFTICRMDSVLMGALLAFMISNPKVKDLAAGTKTHSTLFILAVLCAYTAILLTLAEPNPYWKNGGFILTNLLCTFTVFIAIRNPRHYLFSSKVLRWIGKRSYGLYLYHFPIFLAFEGMRQQGNMTNFLWVSLLRCTVSLAFAACSYEYIEQPILRYKKRYEAQKLVPVS